MTTTNKTETATFDMSTVEGFQAAYRAECNARAAVAEIVGARFDRWNARRAMTLEQHKAARRSFLDGL
jgi:hypothetical protein